LNIDKKYVNEASSSNDGTQYDLSLEEPTIPHTTFGCVLDAEVA
jgi:hypothetical protein